MHFDAVGCGDGQIGGECHEEVASIGIGIELLVEGGEGGCIHGRRGLHRSVYLIHVRGHYALTDG